MGAITGWLLALLTEAVGVVTILPEGVVGVESQSPVSVPVLSRSELEACTTEEKLAQMCSKHTTDIHSTTQDLSLAAIIYKLTIHFE